MKIDLRDMMMAAAAEVERLMMEFEKELTQPLIGAKIFQLWMTLPESSKEQFKRDKPEAYHALMEAMKKGG